MFDPSEKPRLYGLAPGVDFPRVLIDGLRARLAHAPPEAMADVTIIVNTTRMRRRIRELFDAGPPGLLPRLHLVTHLRGLLPTAPVPLPVPALQRRLELVQLISRFLDKAQDFDTRMALFDLADSLARLMDEMHGEGVDPGILADLDVSDESGHWKRALGFLNITRQFFEQSQAAPDTETCQRLILDCLAAQWRSRPPKGPVIVAGSTGSRGTTLALMQAVARLPQGAVVIPGFDFDMPHEAWADLTSKLTSEDHPQFRFQRLMEAFGLGPADVAPWHDAAPPAPDRNKVISLALRPAPVTDRWLAEGPGLPDPLAAFAPVTLLEAPDPRQEALAIALRLRKAAEDGQRAALITPDRMIGRQVAAALDRWGIRPDDSAGEPLPLTAPGRFLRHVAALFHGAPPVSALLELLKHPLCHSARARNEHLLLTRELELHLRRHGPPFPGPADLLAWAAGRKSPRAQGWAVWLGDCLTAASVPEGADLATRVAAHLALTEELARGSDGADSGGLWQAEAGETARRTMEGLRASAGLVDAISAIEYSALLNSVLEREPVRISEIVHPDILIWGTLEARVQGADLLILAGLNEGTWPDRPGADPWLNRRMRDAAGLLLPERHIGLAAHDFQQAVAAAEVWLTRSLRSDDAQTVPSRWINRLQNLLRGLPERQGPDALQAMVDRGTEWLARARRLEAAPPLPRAPRPSPRPPVEVRPRELPVTEIQKLIRDPYATYAKRILGLFPLNPLDRAPDALLRGIVSHDVLETFIKETLHDPAKLTREALLATADAQLRDAVPWASARVLWRARLANAADWFIETEIARQRQATPAAFEQKGRMELAAQGFTLTAKADRIDIDREGRIVLYDYKTGTPPNAKRQKHFDKQLLLEAAIAESAGFGAIRAAPVIRAAYIGVGATPVEVDAPIEDGGIDATRDELARLIGAYFTAEQGYTARRAMFSDKDVGDYDQLARFGEWDVTDDPVPEDLT